jgi:cysteine desulfurase
VRADLVSLSAHKMYGPKGIGALYVRRRPRTRLAPLFSGGGQERGFRPGTLPVPMIVAMGEAARLATLEGPAESERLRRQADRLLALLGAAIPGLTLNGHRQRRVAGNLNLTFPARPAAEILRAAPDLCLSTSSACTTAADGAVGPSHVLTAIGLSPDAARRSLRIGLGRFTSDEDVEAAAEHLATAGQPQVAAAAWSAAT